MDSGETSREVWLQSVFREHDCQGEGEGARGPGESCGDAEEVGGEEERGEGGQAEEEGAVGARCVRRLLRSEWAMERRPCTIDMRTMRTGRHVIGESIEGRGEQDTTCACVNVHTKQTSGDSEFQCTILLKITSMLLIHGWLHSKPSHDKKSSFHISRPSILGRPFLYIPC
jgi:hypothetical protein